MSFIITSIIMFLFWILLSGEFNFVLILSAVVSSLLVAYMSHDLLIGEIDIRLAAIKIIRFIKYLPWLLWQIVLSNKDLVYRTLHPDMPIEPVVIEFDTQLRTEMGITILANSITLTPGTVTLEADSNGRYIVHAIAGGPADSLLAGDMQARVKKIEGE